MNAVALANKPVEFYGKEASDFTKKALLGKTIYLEKDVSDTDRYGRMLRYIWLEIPKEINEKEISILTENLDKTISYILNDCPDEEFYWMSEVFEEIVQKVQSMDFINAIKERLKKVTNEKYYKDIEQEIEDAIDYLE